MNILFNFVIKNKTFKAQVEYWSIDCLIPYPNNAKQHPPEQIAKLVGAIAEFGWDVPIVVDEEGSILKGHGRHLAAMQMQIKEVPVIVRRGLTEAEKKAIRISDNKVAESPWDDELLKLELESLVEMDFDLELTGFDAEDLTSFTDGNEYQASQVIREESEDEVSQLIEEAEEGAIASRVKPGEIWKLGRHYIACADCTIEENVRKLLGYVSDRQPSMVWADPPYGINIVKTKEGLGSTHAAKPFGSSKERGSAGAGNACAVGVYAAIAGDGSIDAAVNSYTLCQNMMSKATMFFWGGNYFAHQLPPSPCWILWDKRDGMTSNNFADAEVAWTNQTTPIRVFAHLWNGMIKASEKGERRVHPTQKPVALAKWCFNLYGQSSDLIFDPFLGSGISIIAAEQMEGDRTVVGFELSEHYCEIICQRWEKLTGQTAQLVGTI